jgi:hypothetical protein
MWSAKNIVLFFRGGGDLECWVQHLGGGAEHHD